MLDDRTGRIFRKTTSATLQPGPEVPPDERVSLMRELLESNFVFSSVTLRREVFDLVGTFDETLEVAEDYDLWLRVAAHDLRMARIREPLAVYRRTPGTVSRNDLLLETNRREIFRRLAASETLPPVVTELAARKAAVAERRIATFSGAGGLGSIVYHARRRLSPLKNVLLDPVLRYRKLPPSLATAPLDLEPQDRRRG
jgi:GT2 family glycosyltransferase